MIKLQVIAKKSGTCEARRMMLNKSITPHHHWYAHVDSHFHFCLTDIFLGLYLIISNLSYHPNLSRMLFYPRPVLPASLSQTLRTQSPSWQAAVFRVQQKNGSDSFDPTGNTKMKALETDWNTWTPETFFFF